MFDDTYHRIGEKRGPYQPTVILHGGAGSVTRAKLPPSLYAQYHASLLKYLTSTQALLDGGRGNAIDAVCHAVCMMEDDPLFNCGRGSVFTTAGTIEMEASLAVTSITDDAEYEGKIKRSAAVSMISRTRHPILLAREVLKMADGESTPPTALMHGHLSGQDVEEWGWQRGLEKKSPHWFWTRKRWEEHRRGLENEHRNDGDGEAPNTAHNNRNGAAELSHHNVWANEGAAISDDKQEDILEDCLSVLELPSQGTVGAVCMDSWGVIAVATSTGGLTNKRPGRIGDTPTVGAGFWAESWHEEIGLNHAFVQAMVEPTPSLPTKLLATVSSGFRFWLGDCLPHFSFSTQYQLLHGGSSIRTMGNKRHDSRQPGCVSCGEQSTFHPYVPVDRNMMSECHAAAAVTEETEDLSMRRTSTRRRAIALSGTGNGDSFLRTNACRTVAAILRFSQSTDKTSLADAVSAVAGPGGELQRSAGDRWYTTGEGDGGMIGIELLVGGKDGTGAEQHQSQAVFDFNCSSMWRAYFEKDKNGLDQPKIMVFREEY